ncbi:MAG: TonB-dependent receptor [Alphaproteobacteria bacterium]|nr:TonB-dependent receptor [Alphaproteobacteria bacterium]
MSKKRILGRFLTTTMLTGVAASAAMPAFAQDNQSSDQEKIVVTGTRIARPDLAAPSPVTAVNAQQLSLVNTVNNEQYLEQMPQLIPAFDSTSNNPGDGSATINLRGLGTKRTLVLVDGMRFVPKGVGSTIDINNIPTALIDRVDVTTGGASAVYGSDAMAGVVNFILKKDFEGVQLDVSDEMSAQNWDGNIFNTALTMGGNFANGKGNAVFSASYTNRQPVLQGGRGFTADTLSDPKQGNTASGFRLGGSVNIPGAWILGNGNTDFNMNGVGTTDTTTAQPYYQAIDPSCVGNICQGFRIDNAGNLRGFRFGVPNDRYNYAPDNYLQLPQERYSIYGGANYQLSDNIEVYARGVFAHTVVDQQLAPTPAFLGFTINLDNPSIPTALRNIIAADPESNNGDGTANVFIAKRYEEVGPRHAQRVSSTFQIMGGATVDLGDGWTWKTDASFGRSTVTQVQTGNISAAALQAALLCDGGPTALASGCTAPYANLFGGPGSISPAAATFISRTGEQYDQIEQTQIVSTINGVFDNLVMPAAKDGVAVVGGVEYRENFADSLPDSTLGPDVKGFNASLPVGGRYDVYEAFMETDIPVIQDKPFIEDFSINGAYRFSSYSTVGSTHTYAVGGEWQPMGGLRFRSQYQHAVRAPNIGELFSAQTNGFPGAHDPCSGGSNGSYFDPSPLGPVIDSLCIASGVAVPGSNVQSNAQIEVTAGGNPNLKAEIANTLTIGAVWQPEQVKGLTLQVDYYRIKVDNAVAVLSLQTVLDSCYRLGITSYCAQIPRLPSGAIRDPAIPSLTVQNIASLLAKGIDFQAEYSYDLGEYGSLTFNYNGSYTLKNGFVPDPITGYVECSGFYGDKCGQPTPKYKHTMTANWTYGPLTTSLRWRLLPSMNLLNPGNASALSDHIGMFNYLDVTEQYALGDHMVFTVGVKNITGKDAPLIGSQYAEQSNTFPATYNTLGRQLFFGGSFKF